MDAASLLEREFAARVGGARDDQPGNLLGIEQEFTVHTRSAGRADFRTLLEDVPVVGKRLDPNDPNAYRTPSGRDSRMTRRRGRAPRAARSKRCWSVHTR